MHIHIHTCMYIQTDIRIGACTRILTHARPHALQKNNNIKFRSKKLDVRKVRDVYIYTHVCRHVPNTDIHSYPYTRERMHARKRVLTDRQMHGCLRARRMHNIIHTYRQTGARWTACAHTRTNAYVRTHVHNTYIPFACLI